MSPTDTLALKVECPLCREGPGKLCVTWATFDGKKRVMSESVHPDRAAVVIEEHQRTALSVLTQENEQLRAELEVHRAASAEANDALRELAELKAELKAQTSGVSEQACWLVGIVNAVGYSKDDFNAHMTLAHVADLVELLGAELEFKYVWEALGKLVVGPLDDADHTELLRFSCGSCWAEAPPPGGK